LTPLAGPTSLLIGTGAGTRARHLCSIAAGRRAVAANYCTAQVARHHVSHHRIARRQDDAEFAPQRSGVQKAVGFVGYAWQIGVNLLYLVIIAFRTHQLDPN
jgi:hypothetical protein